MATKKIVNTKKTAIATVASAVAKAAVPARTAKAKPAETKATPKTVAAALREDLDKLRGQLAESEALRTGLEDKNSSLLDAHQASQAYVSDLHQKLERAAQKATATAQDIQEKDEAAYRHATENSELKARIDGMQATESDLRAALGEARLSCEMVSQDKEVLQKTIRALQGKSDELSTQLNHANANGATQHATNTALAISLSRIPGWIRNLFGVPTAL